MDEANSKPLKVKKLKDANDPVDTFFNHGVHIASRTIYAGSAFSDAQTGDSESGVDSDMAQRVIKSVHLLTRISKEPIKVILNTFGGTVEHGMAIYDCLRASGCEITVEVYGAAMSMGSIILQAAHNRFLHENAFIMVHDGSMSVEATSKSFEAWARWCKFNRHQMYQIYAHRTGKTAAYWEKKCAQDYILTADEAVVEGLADLVLHP